MSQGSKKINAKNCHSVQNECIILRNFSDDVKIKDVSAVPILHILLGIVNKTYSVMLVKIPCVSAWPAALYINRVEYHGHQFQGNECKKLLDNLMILEQIINDNHVYDEGLPFLSVFKSFAKVNHLYHESIVDTDELDAAISLFAEAWKNSEMSLTTKAHIVIDHLLDFVIAKNSVNMKVYAEQSHEAAHAEFAKTWQKYCIKNISNPRYKQNLLRAVLDYNGSHAR